MVALILKYASIEDFLDTRSTTLRGGVSRKYGPHHLPKTRTNKRVWTKPVENLYGNPNFANRLSRGGESSLIKPFDLARGK